MGVYRAIRARGRNRTGRGSPLATRIAVRCPRVFGPPVTAETWTIARGDGDRLRITLRGEFEERHAVALEATLRERLADVAAGAIEAVIDIGGLLRCSVEAREVLLRTQRSLGGVARRTAYIANRPLFRGLGLWICHQAPDAHARTFVSLAQAEPWLAESVRRDEDLARNAARWLDRVRKEASA